MDAPSYRALWQAPASQQQHWDGMQRQPESLVRAVTSGSVQRSWTGGSVTSVGTETRSMPSMHMSTPSRASLPGFDRDITRSPTQGSSSFVQSVMPSSWAQVAKIFVVVALVAAAAAVALGPHGGKQRLESTPWAPQAEQQPLSYGAFRGGQSHDTSDSRLVDKDSMWCFALMVPFSYEQKLLEAQLGLGVGVFGCTEYTIFSNDTFVLRPSPPASVAPPKAGRVTPGSVAQASTSELYTLPIGGSLHVELGGKWKTAMNTDIFVRVWTAAILLGTFRKHAWTVKADPDTVFLPARLQSLLRTEPEGAVYLNNCKFGLHGPLEVFSTQAVKAWWEGKDHCKKHFWRLCSGDCFWGEDMFVDQCLQKVVKVPRDTVETLLFEDHCDPPKGWDSCESKTVVAFHPFKDVKSYAKCLDTSSGVR
mmetsp:Transcript_64194/g.184472  ORF Transcript_64194/g.184472 Transcript_64194/m.184472 type:complete len:421 (+) Transcript_64194:90-1352(+)